jgi:hypothetical protein
VSAEELKLAAQKQEIYLKSQMGTKQGTLAFFGEKKEARQ